MVDWLAPMGQYHDYYEYIGIKCLMLGLGRCKGEHKGGGTKSEGHKHNRLVKGIDINKHPGGKGGSLHLEGRKHDRSDLVSRVTWIHIHSSKHPSNPGLQMRHSSY